MELPLGPDPRTATIRRLQALLVQRFGHIERAAAEWRQPEWVLVQGVIGARTKSEISNAATDRLLRRWGCWEAVATAPLADSNDAPSAPVSIGSPSAVPVPCASMHAGPPGARVSTVRNSACCACPFGAVRLALFPS